MKRLFIALLPDPATQRRWALSVPTSVIGRRVVPSNLHATLAFLGQCSAAQESAAASILATCDFAPFDLTLDVFGVWKKPQILWLGAQKTPSSLTAFADELNRKLGAAGFVLDKRPFALHITLVRKCRGDAPAFGGAPFQWTADTVALMQSVSTERGVAYRCLNKKTAAKSPLS
jgi:2'-5' RNA ligase